MNHLFVLTILTGIFFSQSARAETTGSKLNVIYLLSDNQSYYEMGCHGHSEVKTPHIDRLAEQSIDFQNFHAPPYCSPSRSAMMTGLYALRSGVHDTIGGRSIMHHRDQTIADILKENGYTTGIFGKWHLGSTYPHRPEDRGFDEVFIHHGGGVGQLEDYFSNDHHDTTFFENGEVVHSKGYSTDAIFDRAMYWIKQQQDKPFFCFVSTPATHSPHQAPKGYKGNALYGMIENFDMNLGRMVELLDDLGLADDTLVVFASDQGMEDRGSPEGVLCSPVWHDSKHHVPFMVRLPGGRKGVSKSLVGMIDFAPTVLDLCDIEIPGNMDGVSLKPLLTGNGEDYPSERVLIVQCPRQRDSKKWRNASVKMGKWRLTSGKQLFDVEHDPRQTQNVAAKHPETVQLLANYYDSFWASIPAQSETLSRHLLGSDASPEVRLCGVDWYKGALPWGAGEMHAEPHKKKNQNGAWAVKIAEDGKYRFELRRFPREANKPIGLKHAKIMVGDVVAEKSFSANDAFVTFDLDLKAGDYDLKTWLNPDAQNTMNYGALFVYVTK